jgi:hypothetical protein
MTNRRVHFVYEIPECEEGRIEIMTSIEEIIYKCAEIDISLLNVYSLGNFVESICFPEETQNLLINLQQKGESLLQEGKIKRFAIAYDDEMPEDPYFGRFRDWEPL